VVVGNKNQVRAEYENALVSLIVQTVLISCLFSSPRNETILAEKLAKYSNKDVSKSAFYG